MTIRRDLREFIGTPAVFASDAMRQLLTQVEKVAKTNATVLITGESGSGKEVIARAIHHYSMRSAKSWVDVNCAALPENLLESELFGYEKGAFSGADQAKPGLFEIANHGTLLLDEIGDLDLRMQVKLLRVLDGASYYRVGGVRKVSSDVRLIAATNQDLKIAVEEGRFRSDLYHRLCQIRLCVPPLRERKEDILPPAEFYWRSRTHRCDSLPKRRRNCWPIRGPAMCASFATLSFALLFSRRGRKSPRRIFRKNSANNRFRKISRQWPRFRIWSAARSSKF